MKRPSRTKKVLCPICWTELTTEQKQTLMNNIEPNWYIRAPMQQVNIYQEKIRSREVDIFPTLRGCAEYYEQFQKLVQDEKHNNYKYTCSKKNTQCYIKLYRDPESLKPFSSFYLKDNRYKYEKWSTDTNLLNTLLKERKSKAEI